MKSYLKKNLNGLIAIFAALLLIAAGLVFKQYDQVLGKAVRICLECIGIG